MNTVYVLLEKDRSTEDVTVHDVYDTFDLAQEVMKDRMSFWGEYRSYKIVQRKLNQR